MHAPIELGPRLYGVLTVGHDEPDRFGDEDLDLLVKLARSSAAAIANAIDYPARAPHRAGADARLRARVAARAAGLRDRAALRPRRQRAHRRRRLRRLAGRRRRSVAVLVGDVAGKGVETAALSAMVRFFIEARSWDALGPAKVLEQANAMLLGRLPPDTFVTAFLGMLSRDSLALLQRGPPAAAARAGRSGVAGSRATACRSGSRRTRTTRRSELRLEPGDLVFAYTDGLIEARRKGEMYGHGAARGAGRGRRGGALAAGARARGARGRGRLGGRHLGRRRGPRARAAAPRGDGRRPFRLNGTRGARGIRASRGGPAAVRAARSPRWSTCSRGSAPGGPRVPRSRAATTRTS